MVRTNIIFVRLIVLLIVGVTIASCKKNNFGDHLGESLCPSENFAYTEQPSLSASSINLATQKLVASASFNEEVPWTVIIKGETSKSFKKFSGHGNSINISWNGNPDTTIFFKSELCTVEFRIACKEPIVKGFSITSLNTFATSNYLVYNGDGGALGMGPYSGGGGGNSVNSINATLNSPQGGNCYCTTGNAAAPTWYFGGLGFDTPNLPSYIHSDPSKVYVNFFVNTQGSTASIPVLAITESGVPVPWKKNILVYGMDWHFVSVKLSDMNVLNPTKITNVSFGLNAYPEQSTSGKMCVDFVLFTNDAPFIAQ